MPTFRFFNWSAAPALPCLVLGCGLWLAGTAAQADVYDDVERLIRNQQLARAHQTSSEHLQKSPQDPQMRLLLSRILSAQGQSQAAQEVLQALTREFPELPEPHNNLAVLYAAQGRSQEALDSLHRALAARADYATALENLGDLHLSLALQAYQRAKALPQAPLSVLRKTDTLALLLSPVSAPSAVPATPANPATPATPTTPTQVR